MNFIVMKYFGCVFLFATLASDSMLTLAVPNSGDDYQLVFSDEFNQEDYSRPDSSKWSVPPRANSTWSRWISTSPNVAFIYNGHLVCRAIPNRELEKDTAVMLTGAVYSKNKFAFQYGKVEVRLRTNLLPGNFPAVWMGGMPQLPVNLYGEIDIFESFGQKRESNHNIHSELTVKNRNHQQRNSFRKSVSINRWHIYGIEWSANKVVWYIDRIKVGEYLKSADEQLLSKGQWTFDRPFYLLLNQSVGDGSHGLVPDTTKTYETHFDWIRVYQKTRANDRQHLL